jgi:hypothetical protein
MRAVDDYIPVELWHESKNFIQVITDDVEIYKKIRNFDSVKKSDEADKFVAWWDFERFADNPMALILIQEKLTEILKTITSNNLIDGYEQLQYKLILFYRLLKANGYIND